jgi:L-amino acid N-acyltransferase YncA
MNPLPQPPANSIAVRQALESDLSAINDIYNHYVLNSTCTYQEEEETIEARRQWFETHGAQHPIITAEMNGRIVGWGSLAPFHSRCAYRRTVENSVYVHHEHHCRGVGSALLGNLIRRARSLEHHAIIAGIDGEQTGSFALHAKFGFQKVGHLKQVGFKFGRWLDVIYMQLTLET